MRGRWYSKAEAFKSVRNKVHGDFIDPGAKGVFFVTRLKRNAVFKLLERRLVNRKTGVTSDHIIEVSKIGRAHV